MTAWHWAACEGNLDVLHKLWKWAKENLTKENFKNKMLLVTDNEGWTAWHRATYVGILDVLQKLWNWAE
jgi:ankyrin repeat protein